MDKSGTVHKTLVLDAAYRGYSIFADLGKTESGYTITAFFNILPTEEAVLITDYLNIKDGDSDSTIIAYTNYVEDPKSTNYTTNRALSYSNPYAANWCRYNNGSGISADLPNIQTLMRVYACKTKIDELDPTVSSYTNRSLSSWNKSDDSSPFGVTYFGYYVWSSSLGTYAKYGYTYGVNGVSVIDIFGRDSVGLITTGAITNNHGVIPTLDL